MTPNGTDWSSDVCSSDLLRFGPLLPVGRAEVDAVSDHLRRRIPRGLSKDVGGIGNQQNGEGGGHEPPIERIHDGDQRTDETESERCNYPLRISGRRFPENGPLRPECL